SYVVQNWKPVNRKTITIKQVFQPVKQVVTPVKKVRKAIGKDHLIQGCPTRNERLSSGNRDSYVVQNWKPVNPKTTTIKQVFQPVKQVVTPVKNVWKATGKVLPVEHSSRVSTSVDVVVSSRFTKMPVTSYKHKARKAPDVSVIQASFFRQQEKCTCQCALSSEEEKSSVPVEHSSSVSTSMDVVVSSRFTKMPVTSYKRKARKAPGCSHHDDVCSYQFRPRSSDNKKSVRVSALFLRRKRNIL
nr:hypothetical protein [Tanacetum cinerariifolium]